MPRQKKEMTVPKPRQLSNGKWYIYLRLQGEAFSITDLDYDRCIARARAIKTGIIEAESTKKFAKKTLFAAIDDYIASRASILSPSTIRGYRIIQKNRFQSLMEKDVTAITPHQLQKAVDMESRIVSAKTVKNAYGLINAAISYNTGREMKVTLPQVVPNEHPFLTPEQLPIFIDAIKDTDIELPCLLGLWSLRQSEISALFISDIDFKNNTIHVCRSTVPDENNVFVIKPETKNITSNRFVPLFPRIKDLIPKDWPDKTPIVHIHPGVLRRKINRICAINKLPQIGVHGLRHSFASLGYFLGIPEKELMAIGGWSNDATMRRIYTHISRKQKQNAAQKMMDFYSTEVQNVN